MKLKSIQLLLVMALLLSASWAQAAITCTSITSPGFSTAYSGVAPNITQTSLTVTCNRNLAGDPTTLNYSVSANNGLQPNGQNNRAAWVGNYIRYELYKNSTCATAWKSNSPITATMNLSGFVSTSQTTTYWGCITVANQTVPAGGYTDTVTMTLSYNTSPTLTLVNTFPVAIYTPATCTISSSPGSVVFNYIGLGSAVAASTTFGATCTNSLPYTMALDTTSGTLVGLTYSLALSTGSSTGTGLEQTHSINGTMAAGQAGTCATGSCSGSQAHTLTITY